MNKNNKIQFTKEQGNDKESVMAAISNDPLLIKYASQNMRDNEEVMSYLAKMNGHLALFRASDRLRDDKKFVKLAVENRGDALEFASTRLQADKEIVSIAMKQNKDFLMFASDELKDEFEYDYPYKDATKEEILNMKEERNIFKTLPCKFRFDKDIVLKFAKIQGVTVLKYTSDELRDDYDFIKNNFGLLDFASDRLRDDLTLALLHIYNRGALREVSDKLRDNKKFATLALIINPLNYNSLSFRLQNDKDIKNIQEFLPQMHFSLYKNMF